MTDLVEGQAEEVGGELEVVDARPPALFGTHDPVEVIERAGKIATALADVINRQGMYHRIGAKDHVTIEGWQTLGAMLGVTASIVWTREVGNGDWEARAEAFTADGRMVGAAEAMCADAEGGMWKGAKAVNARRAMAQTRALSRAYRGPLGFVVNLAGYATTAAEEMPSNGSAPAPTPAAAPAGPLVTDEQAQTILTGVELLAGHGVKAGTFLVSQGATVDKASIENTVRSLPAASADAVCQWLSDELDKVKQ